jgi:transposase
MESQSEVRQQFRPAGPGALALILATAVLSILSVGTIQAAGCTESWNNASGGPWSTASNWTPATVPGATDNACINLNGTYTVVFRSGDVGVSSTIGSFSLGGTSGIQTLRLASTCSAHTVLTATNGSTNGATGVLDLTNDDSCGDNATLAGPITNAGLISLDQANGGLRQLQVSITNTGTIADNPANGFFNASGTTLSNQGTLTVANGDTLTVNGGTSFTNSSGTVVATGSTGTGLIFQSGTGTFTQEGALAAVPRKQGPGPKPRVTAAWEEELLRVIEDDPHDYGVNSANWTTQLLADYLAAKTGLAVDPETVRRSLHRHDYVCKRPTWTVADKAAEREGPRGHPVGKGSGERSS